MPRVVMARVALDGDCFRSWISTRVCAYDPLLSRISSGSVLASKKVKGLADLKIWQPGSQSDENALNDSREHKNIK